MDLTSTINERQLLYVLKPCACVGANPTADNNQSDKMALTNENKESLKGYIEILVATAKKCGCPKCKGEIKQIKNRTFRCKKGCGDFVIDPKLIKKFRDSFDSRNWKATCDECGGKMDYYNFKYCCRKCGSILEV